MAVVLFSVRTAVLWITVGAANLQYTTIDQGQQDREEQSRLLRDEPRKSRAVSSDVAPEANTWAPGDDAPKLPDSQDPPKVDGSSSPPKSSATSVLPKIATEASEPPPDWVPAPVLGSQKDTVNAGNAQEAAHNEGSNMAQSSHNPYGPTEAPWSEFRAPPQPPISGYHTPIQANDLSMARFEDDIPPPTTTTTTAPMQMDKWAQNIALPPNSQNKHVGSQDALCGNPGDPWCNACWVMRRGTAGSGACHSGISNLEECESQGSGYFWCPGRTDYEIPEEPENPVKVAVSAYKKIEVTTTTSTTTRPIIHEEKPLESMEFVRHRTPAGKTVHCYVDPETTGQVHEVMKECADGSSAFCNGIACSGVYGCRMQATRIEAVIYTKVGHKAANGITGSANDQKPFQAFRVNSHGYLPVWVSPVMYTEQEVEEVCRSLNSGGLTCSGFACLPITTGFGKNKEMFCSLLAESIPVTDRFEKALIATSGVQTLVEKAESKSFMDACFVESTLMEYHVPPELQFGIHHKTNTTYLRKNQDPKALDKYGKYTNADNLAHTLLTMTFHLVMQCAWKCDEMVGCAGFVVDQRAGEKICHLKQSLPKGKYTKQMGLDVYAKGQKGEAGTGGTQPPQGQVSWGHPPTLKNNKAQPVVTASSHNKVVVYQNYKKEHGRAARGSTCDSESPCAQTLTYTKDAAECATICDSSYDCVGFVDHQGGTNKYCQFFSKMTLEYDSSWSNLYFRNMPKRPKCPSHEDICSGKERCYNPLCDCPVCPTAPPNTPLDTCKNSDGMTGYDFSHDGSFGGQIANFDGMSSPAHCANKCNNQAKCIGFSFNLPFGKCYTYLDCSAWGNQFKDYLCIEQATKSDNTKSYIRCNNPPPEWAKFKGHLSEAAAVTTAAPTTIAPVVTAAPQTTGDNTTNSTNSTER